MGEFSHKFYPKSFWHYPSHGYSKWLIIGASLAAALETTVLRGDIGYFKNTHAKIKNIFLEGVYCKKKERLHGGTCKTWLVHYYYSYKTYTYSR